MTFLNKVPRSESITAGIATSKALVGHIKESKVALLLHNVANLAPLVLGRINTSRVMRAGVKKDNAVARGSLNISKETLKVKTDSILVVVAVLLDLETAILEDGIVVGPAWGREVDLLRVGVEALQERTADSQSSRSGDGLGNAETAILNHGRIGAVRELSGGRG